MEIIVGVVIGCLSSVFGVWAYFEIQYRRNRKKVWKGRL